MKLNFFALFFSAFIFQTAVQAQTDYVNFSVRLLTAVKKKQPVDSLFSTLAGFSKDSLAAGLATDDQRKAFWLNVHNAAVQHALQIDSTLILLKAAFPEKELVTVAGRSLPPDFIIHRILRRSKNKYGLGYVNRLFVSDYEKLMRVEYVDYRIHFALSFGTAGSGPVDIYKTATVDDQLSWSTVSFLQQEVTYDSLQKKVTLPKIMEWYKADFGGDKGLLQLMQKLLIVPENEKTKLLFRDYNWALRPGRYR